MKNKTTNIGILKFNLFFILLNFLFCSILPTVAWSATYYIDTTGSDSAAGTSISTAWKTLAKVNGYSSLKAGDTVLLKRGCEWRETLSPPITGTITAPVTFGAYGTGNKPIINGATNLFDTTYTWLQNGTAWSTTLATDPGSIWFTKDSSIGWGRRQDTTAALTSKYDWAWISGTLYIFSDTDPKVAYDSIEAATRTYGITAGSGTGWGANHDYIVIQDMEVKFTKQQGIYIGHARDASGVSDASKTNDYWTVQKMTVHHNGVSNTLNMMNINFSGTGHVIKNNVSYETIGNGINCNADCYSNTIEHNTIYNNHHHGIDLKTPGSNNIIAYNTLYESNMSTNVTGINKTNVINAIALGVDGGYGGTMGNDKIYGNLVYDFSGIGLLIKGTAINVKIFNNVVANVKAAAYGIEGSNLVTLKNNIGIRTNDPSFNVLLSVKDSTGKTIDNNCWYSPITTVIIQVDGYGNDYYNNTSSWSTYKNMIFKSGQHFDSNSIISDPRVTDLTNHDFHLQSNSPCIDKGIDVGLKLDLDNIAIPQANLPDIGAFEYEAPAANNPPVANNQLITLVEDNTKAITLSATDADSGDTLTYSIVTPPGNGTLSGTGANKTYTPTANYSGSDSFTFVVNDGKENSNIATVSITITPVNDSPSAPQGLTATARGTNQINLSWYEASDPDNGDVIKYNLYRGSTAISSALSATSYADTSLNSSTAYSYQVEAVDKAGTKSAKSSVASATTLTPVNQAPTISNITNQNINEDANTGALAFTIGDVETAAGSLTLSKTSSNTALVPVSNIVFGGSGANRTVTITPLANQSGSATITITVSDGTLTASDSFVLTVAAVNDAPVIISLSASPTSGTIPLIVSFNASASDADGSTLTYSYNFGDGTTGTGASVSHTYTTADSYTATLTVKDPSNAIATQSAIIKTSAAVKSADVNNAPVAKNISVSLKRKASKTITLSAADSDNNSLTYRITQAPSKGTATIQGQGPSVVYKAPNSVSWPYGSTYTMKYKANDGKIDSNEATVTIKVSYY